MTDPVDDPTTSRSPAGGLHELWRGVPFAVTLLGFWVLLSGKLDVLHLGAGVVCAGAVTSVTGRLLRLPPALGARPDRPLAGIRWLRLAGYVPWLIWQVVLANVHVARIVLDPRLPIDPTLVRLDRRLPHALARLMIANSITITPGTVTLDVDGEGFLVHALTRRAASGLEHDAMLRRVQSMFTVPAAGGAPPGPPVSGAAR